MAGGLVHFEIHVNDMERARNFYTEVFDWKFRKVDMPIEYWLFQTGRTQMPDGSTAGIDGGMLKKSGKDGGEGASPNAFVCTVGVDDIDDTLEKAKKLGATTQMEKDKMPGIGWLSYLKDPEDNIFGVLQPEQ